MSLGVTHSTTPIFALGSFSHERSVDGIGPWVLLQLVRQHALDRLAVVRLCDLLNCVRDRVGLVARLYKPKGRLRREVSGHDGVRGATLDLVVLGAPDDDGVRDYRDEAVDVSAQVDLHHVAVLERDVRVTVHWREMADAVVDRDAAWEGDALLHLLVLLERLRGFLLDALVTLGANLSH